MYAHDMSVRIWASLDDYLPSSSDASRLGRNMANHYFISALLRYGTFDEYHFFMSNAAHKRMFLEAHEPLVSSLGLAGRVKVFERTELPAKLSAHDYTVFHQSDHINYFNALCRLRNCLGQGFPVTAFIHSISYQEYMPRYLEMSLLGAGQNDALICSSRCGRDALKKVFLRLDESFDGAALRMQLPVVSLGIDEREQAVTKAAARETLDIAKEEVVALSLGRFSEIDKMDLFPLLQAFRHIVSTEKNCRLILAGSVHSPKYLEMLSLWIDALNIKDAVRIVANPSEEEKRRLFSAADFFVSTADNPQETFGLTLLEAMHAGLPLIVSDFDGYREIVTDDVGFRIPTLWCEMPELDMLQPLLDERTFHLFAAQSVCVDVEQTANALQALFSDAVLRERMSAAATMRFFACYAHEHIIRRLEALWTELKSSFQRAAAVDKDPLSLGMFDTFSHYVSEHLNPDMRVVTTSLGADILAKRGNYPLLPNMAGIIDIGNVLSVMRRASDPVSIHDLAELFSNPGRLAYTVLWMLKHELLSLER